MNKLQLMQPDASILAQNACMKMCLVAGLRPDPLGELKRSSTPRCHPLATQKGAYF